MVAQVIPDKPTNDFHEGVLDGDVVPQLKTRLLEKRNSYEAAIETKLHRTDQPKDGDSEIGTRRNAEERRRSSILQIQKTYHRIRQDAQSAGLDVTALLDKAIQERVAESSDAAEDRCDENGDDIENDDDQSAQLKSEIDDLQQWIGFLQGKGEQGGRSAARLEHEIAEEKRRILSKKLLQRRGDTRRKTFLLSFRRSDICRVRQERIRQYFAKLWQKLDILFQITRGHWTPDVTRQMNIEVFSRCCDSACVSLADKKAHTSEVVDLTARAIGKTNTLFFQFFPPTVLISKFAEAMNDPAPYPLSFYRKGTLLAGKQKQTVDFVYATCSPRVSPKWSKRGDMEIVEYIDIGSSSVGAPPRLTTKLFSSFGFGTTLCARVADMEEAAPPPHGSLRRFLAPSGLGPPCVRALPPCGSLRSFLAPSGLDPPCVRALRTWRRQRTVVRLMKKWKRIAKMKMWNREMVELIRSSWLARLRPLAPPTRERVATPRHVGKRARVSKGKSVLWKRP